MSSSVLAQQSAQTRALATLQLQSGAPLHVSRSPVTGLPTYIGTSAGHEIDSRLSASAPAVLRATTFLESAAPAVGLVSSADAQWLASEGPDEVAMEHVRYRQMHGPIPVASAGLIVHLQGARVSSVNGHILPDISIDTIPSLGTEEAKAAASNAADEYRQDRTPTQAPIWLSEPRLEILNVGFYERRQLSQTRLAWFIEATAPAFRNFIWIDAQDGRVLLQFSQLTDARNRFVHTADSGSSLPGRLARSEGGGPTGDIDVDNAYDYAGDTYDYYFSEHGRDSYDGSGAALVSTVDWCGPGGVCGSCPCRNAFWDGVQMVYGDGFSAADDVVAHELTHAVTEYSANLIYCLQSGALNESFSDIFGEAIDLSNTGGTDTASVRWLLGEDIPGIGAIRNMRDPTLFGNPGKISDPEFFCAISCAELDNGGVHFNSGVPNHAFALMVDGGSYNGFNITGIGLTKAGKIQYRALTQYLTSNSTFLDDYNALNQSCQDLIGTAGIGTSDCTEVTKALQAVEMNRPACEATLCGNGIVESGEECDDGNATQGDGCEPDCTLSPGCTLRRATDLSPGIATRETRELLICSSSCGNGLLESGEECDDGDTANCDGCDANCTITRCANGIVACGEECDDGNTIGGDGCEPDCTLSQGCVLYRATDLPQAIPDLGSISSIVDVPASADVFDVDVVDLTGTHSYVGDLAFQLTSPLGTAATLFAGICARAPDFALSLDDQAGSPIPCPPTDGLGHTPVDSLSIFAGQQGSGAWVLTVSDLASADVGTLDSWGLLICPASSCGNGVTEPGEECDDGDSRWVMGESCDANCRAVDCADVDNNGEIGAVDGLFILRVAIGLASCDACVCNVDGSIGASPITATDGLLTLQSAVLLPGTLACPACR
jgi:cysteine-rich repeat protein